MNLPRRIRAGRLQFELLESRRLLAADLRITELMASNNRTLADGNGDSSDWIELYNAGTEALDLAGWHLTDDFDVLDKWTFPSYMLGADEYLVVFASGQGADGYTDFEAHLHSNFKLSKDGEYLALTDKNMLVVQEFAPSFPQQFVDISYGMGPLADLYFHQPTPGNANSSGYLGVTQSEIIVSRGGGTFLEPFSLTLTTDAPGGDIYYTTDGSLPTEDSILYVDPFTIDSTTQVRARVIQADRVSGPLRAESYVRLAADVAGFTSQLPIMVIDNFGGGAIPNKGWNSTGSGIRAVDRQAAHLMLFASEEGLSSLTRTVDLESRIGIRVRGAFSSSWPEPGYSVEAWEDGIDDDTDIAPLGMSANSDWVLYGPNPSQDRSLIQNTFLFELSNQMGHWATDFRYVEAFINTDGGDVTMSDYVGLYVIEQRVERGDDLLDFEPFAADASSGGWLLEINRLDAISLEGERPKNFHTAGPDGILRTPPDLSGGSSRGDDIPRQRNAYINFADPGGYEINSVQRQAIEVWMKQMEDVLYDRTDVAWNDPVNGYAKYIDVDSFVDYFILQNLPKTGDGLLISMWLYNPDPNNGGKLTFGPIWDNDFDTDTGSPRADLMHRADRLWYGRLFDDPDFMQKYIDRWQSLRGGPLSKANMEDVMHSLFVHIGDQAAINDGVTDWPTRQEAIRTWVIEHAAAIDRTFVAQPEFSIVETVVASGHPLTISASQGTIYYTTDGSDPRFPGGAVAVQAIEYVEPIVIMENIPITARTFDNGEWSGILEAEFLIASELPLRISEINYQPHRAMASEKNAASDQFEFVELTNTGQQPIDLAGGQFMESNVDGAMEGIVFEFAAQTLEPGQRIVVVRDREAFQSRYGNTVFMAEGRGMDIASGGFNGNLDNRGERLTLLDASGRAIQQFRYFSGKPWPDRAAGRGSTLEVIDFHGSYNMPGNWRASSQYAGSPGDADRGLAGQLVITEVAASPKDGQDDLIELHNTTARDIDVTNWYVSNSSGDYLKAQIRGETTVLAGGYLVLNATLLGIPLDGTRGGEVLLTSADTSGKPFSFVDQIRFGVSGIGTSVGPWPHEDDPFIQLETVTFGGPNSGPKVGEVTISEVHYAPLDLDGGGSIRDRDFAFIELYNRTDRPIDLGGWQLSGDVEFTFEVGTIVSAQEALTVVRFDPSRRFTPTAFRILYDMALDAPLVGGHRDTLDRESGVVQLTRPRVREADDPNFTPMIPVDQITYTAAAPWPASAGGAGESLHRNQPGDLGNLAASWKAAPPSPGTAVFVARHVGDANQDGQFNQLDITIVLQEGMYNTGQLATFRGGDWNGDGFFNQLDIVLALQAGTYLQGPLPVHARMRND